MQKASICFVVHNPGDPRGAASRVQGYRFSTATSDPDRIIVLVHGHSVWSSFWDFQPNFSVARNLARAGYVVVSYDMLGRGNSPYAYPLRATVTADGQRSMLHEVIEQVRHTYSGAKPCGPNPAGTGAHPRVALAGHSVGAGLVTAYPGKYQQKDPGHVDALIAMDVSGIGSFTAPQSSGNVFGHFQITKTVKNPGREISAFLDDGSYCPDQPSQCPNRRADFPLTVGRTISKTTCGIGTTEPAPNNTYFGLYPGVTTQQLYPGNTYPAYDPVCDPRTLETWPFGEWLSYADAPGQPGGLHTDRYTAQIDENLPVLVTFADHDGFVPLSGPDAAGCAGGDCRSAEMTYWSKTPPAKAGHVTFWTQKNAGHAFVFFATMPDVTAELATWLTQNGLIEQPSGSPLRELTLDPQRDYQPLGTPCGRPRLRHHGVRQVATIS